MWKKQKIEFHELKLILKEFGFKITKEEMYSIKDKLDEIQIIIFHLMIYRFMTKTF